MQDSTQINKNNSSKTDDSDADAFAILSILLVAYLAVSYYLNS